MKLYKLDIYTAKGNLREVHTICIVIPKKLMKSKVTKLEQWLAKSLNFDFVKVLLLVEMKEY